MLFRNAIVYRITAEWTMTPAALETLLAVRRLAPCPATAMHSFGWVPAYDGSNLVELADGRVFFALGMHEKILPAAVVNQEAEVRAAAFEEEKGFKPGRKMMREIKERVANEFLPRAFTRQRRTQAMIDIVGGWLIIDTSSQARAEEVIQYLRDALGSLDARPLAVNTSTELAMSSWLMDAQTRPEGITLADDCTLSSNDGAAIRYKDLHLSPEKACELVNEGLRFSQVRLQFACGVELTLTDNLHLRRLQLIGAEDAEPKAYDTNALRWEAEATLAAGVLSVALKSLVDGLGGMRADLFDQPTATAAA